jgi:hypothetical protein
VEVRIVAAADVALVVLNEKVYHYHCGPPILHYRRLVVDTAVVAPHD